MTRAVLDTNVIVSAVLVPSGTQAEVLLLAIRGSFGLVLSEPLFREYQEVLSRPRFKLDRRQIQLVLGDIRRIGHFVRRRGTLSICSHDSDNRVLECAEAAGAHYLVTGNLKHFPPVPKMTRIVTGRQFLDIMGALR